jgi:hypothetical protein
MDRYLNKTLFVMVLSSLLLAPVFRADAQETPDKKGGEVDEPAPPPADKSWAGQLESFILWIIKTRDLVPRTKDCETPCYVLDSLELAGSVDRNSLKFTIKGGVIADKPVLIPLFGPPHQVMLSNVTVNGKPAVVGFESSDTYFVRTGEKAFTVAGDLALGGDLSISIPGPLNLFKSSLEDGKVVEGDRISGLSYATLHLEYGKKEEAEALSALPPVFQVARVLRIQKEISFEYRVTMKSGTEISSLSLPLPHGEVVLDVPGYKEWKQEAGTLTVPVSGRSVEFSIFGRLPEVGLFKPDERCSYEWWLIESDAEHRVLVKTEARQVDSTESPIPRQLESARLYLVTKGQDIDVTVQALASMEALAVVVRSQDRLIIWTKDGDLVAEDRLSYENKGIDYLPFDPSGKPVYLDLDGEAQKILAENEAKKTSILIPLRKGDHAVRVQSLGKSDPSFFGGSLRVPIPKHDLTASRTTVTLGLPRAIIPLWFSGGEGIRSPVRIADVAFVVIALVMALLFFKGRDLRAAGFVALAGFYFIIPPLFVAFVIVCLGVALVVLIWRRLRDWKRIVAFVGLAVLLLIAGFIGALALTLTAGRSAPMSMDMQAQEAYYVTSKVAEPGAYEEGQMGQRSLEVNQKAQQQEIFLGNVSYAGMAAVQGITPVALPLPSYDRAVSVSRELVTKDRPLAPTLIYVTRKALWPVLILWLLCLGFVLWRLWPQTRSLGTKIIQMWKKPEAPKPADAAPAGKAPEAPAAEKP